MDAHLVVREHRTGQDVEQPVALFVVLLAGMVALSATLLLLAAKGVSPDLLLRDTTAIAGLPPYYGALSLLGILGWVAAAAVSLHAWSLLRYRCNDPAMLRVLFLGGLWCAFAGIDDAFLVHEWIAPAIGIPEKVVLAAHGGMAVLFLRATLPVLGRSDWLLLIPAFGALGLSVLLDVFASGGLAHAAEDLAKLGGVFFLAAYLMRASARLLGQRTGAIGW